MLSDEVIEKIVERLVNRIEEVNLYALKKIGGTIKKIGTINPSDVHELVEIMQYGGDYDKIVKKLAEVTELNVKDIYKIFDEVAKTDTQFAEKFYKYRNKKFIPYKDNEVLQRQVRQIAEITADTYRNITRNNVIGFKTRDENGKVIHKGLKETYQDVVDRAVMAISQGKDTYQGQVYSIMKELGASGLTTVEYESGRSVRLDSAVRMQLRGAIRDLHTRTQEEIGKDINADGWEISVHGHPAPDHEDVQGRQFSIEEFNKFQNDELAVSYDGIEFPAEFNNRDRRAIGQYNCYHYPFSIILGLDKPQYSDEQLKKIKEDNDKGFEFEGRHYTLYEGTQLQREIETEIRRQKDLQILGKTGGNEQLANEAQKKINQLTQKYYELHQASDLPTKLDRLRVEGYTEIKLDEEEVVKQKKNGSKSTSRKEKEPKSFDFNEQKEKLRQKGIIVNDDIKELDEDLVKRNLIYLEELRDKYDVTDVQELLLEEGSGSNNNFIGTTFYANNRIKLNKKYYKGGKLLEVEKQSQKFGWHSKVKEDDLDIYTIAHEYGHAIENNYARKYIKRAYGIDTSKRRDAFTYKEKELRQEIDKDIRNSMFRDIQSQEKISITEIKKKYFSGYANSKRHYEWFAETFAQMELGEENPMTRAMKKWLEDNYYE